MNVSASTLDAQARFDQPPIAIRVAAWGIHVPGRDIEQLADEAGGAPEDAAEILGRRGLLGKDPATRLALCAVHRALGLPPAAPRTESPPDPDVAVVASSNFGNVETVQRVAGALVRRGWREVSPLDAPNASSNVLASTVAIWFRWGGPNLMVCSGATSGLDAVALAGLLLRSGRARTVVVVGAEPDDQVASALQARRRARRGKHDRRIRAAAAAVILERAALTDEGIYVGPPRRGLDALDDGGDTPVSILIGPSSLAAGAARVIDVEEAIGDCYGALGVLHVAIAARLISCAPRGSRPSIAIVCGDPEDGWRSIVVGDARIARRMEPAREVLPR